LLGWPPSDKALAQRIKYPPKLGTVQAAKPSPANCETRIATVSRKLTMEDIPQLHKQWIEEFSDLCREIPLRLLPLRPVNHEIYLVDPDKRYHYHLPKCTDHYKEQLLKKIEQYTITGWWIPTLVQLSTPMLCMSKKTLGVLCIVFDLRQQNENTVKDVTPFPDQDTI
jgi:hypothetical protein